MTTEVTVAAAPVVTFQHPQNGQTYRVGQLVPVQFICAKGTNGTGLASCKSWASRTTGKASSTPRRWGRSGTRSRRSRATAKTTTAQITYTVLAWPPIASILWPFDHETFLLNEPVPTTFTYTVTAVSANGQSSSQQITYTVLPTRCGLPGFGLMGQGLGSPFGL